MLKCLKWFQFGSKTWNEKQKPEHHKNHFYPTWPTIRTMYVTEFGKGTWTLHNVHVTSQPHTYKCVSVLGLTMPPTSSGTGGYCCGKGTTWNRQAVWEHQRVADKGSTPTYSHSRRCNWLPVASKLAELPGCATGYVVEGIAGKLSRVLQVYIFLILPFPYR